MKKLIEVPQELKDATLITAIYNMYSEGSAVIAGGYVRDLQLGRRPKDIDVLIELTDSKDYDEARILASRLGYHVQEFKNYDGEDSELAKVMKLTKHGSLGIDLIFLNCTTSQRISNFPCGICKTWLEGSEIKALASFEVAVKDKVLVFRDKIPFEYIDRLRGYFPDYEVQAETDYFNHLEDLENFKGVRIKLPYKKLVQDW